MMSLTQLTSSNYFPLHITPIDSLSILDFEESVRVIWHLGITDLYKILFIASLKRTDSVYYYIFFSCLCVYVLNGCRIIAWVEDKKINQL